MLKAQLCFRSRPRIGVDRGNECTLTDSAIDKQCTLISVLFENSADGQGAMPLEKEPTSRIESKADLARYVSVDSVRIEVIMLFREEFASLLGLRYRSFRSGLCSRQVAGAELSRN